MVLYKRETLIFYAVVDNYKSDICWPINKAVALMQKYGLDIVQVESLGTYNTFAALCDGLTKAFREVAKGKIVEEEEGSVIYLTQRHSSNSAEDRVLSLSKLKTIEYRIFRKMREKLRGYYQSEQGKGNSAEAAKGVVQRF